MVQCRWTLKIAHKIRGVSHKRTYCIVSFTSVFGRQIYGDSKWMSRLRDRKEQSVTAQEAEFSLKGERNILKLVAMVVIAQPSEYTKTK